MAQTPEELEQEKNQQIIPDPKPEVLGAMANEPVYPTPNQQTVNPSQNKYQSQIDQMDQDIADREEDRVRRMTQQKIMSGDYPTYMGEAGMLAPNEDANLSIPVEGAPQFRKITEEEIRPKRRDEFVGPEFTPPESESQPGFVGPQTPKPGDNTRAARVAKKKEDKKRVNDLLMERSRKQRGLPPRNPEARAALESPEAARNFRQSGSASGVPSPVQQAPQAAGAGQTPQGGVQGAGTPKASQIAAGGKFQTGQQVELDNPLSGGQTSTRVYALPDGAALPDGQGMNRDDFVEAYKQLNPGKSMIDAIQGLSREQGATGSAARKILRNIGATGGVPLSDDQKRQLEDQLGDDAADLLQRHSLGMSKAISSGATAIQQQDTRLRKQQQAAADEEEERLKKLRKDAYKRAKELQKQEGGDLVPESELIAQAEAQIMAEQAYIETGETLPPLRPGDEVRTLQQDEYETMPDVMPQSAFQPGIQRDETTGELSYVNEGFQDEMPAVLVQTADGKSIAVPVLDDPSQASALPPGTAYMTNDGQFVKPGKQGRPKSKPEKDESVFEMPDRDSVRREMMGVKQKQIEERNEKFEENMSESFQRLQEAKITLDNAKEKAKTVTSAAAQASVKEAQESFDKREKEYEDKKEQMKRLQEDFEPVTQEEITAEINRRRQVFEDDLTEQEKMEYEMGDPTRVGDRLEQSLPQGEIVDQAGIGKVMKLDYFGQVVAMKVNIDSHGNTVVHPENTEHIAALEGQSKGFVPLGVPGGDSISAASHPSNRDAESIYAQIAEEAKRDPNGLERKESYVQGQPGSDPNDLTDNTGLSAGAVILDRIQQYIDTKYASRNLSAEQREKVEDAMLQKFYPSYFNIR